MPDEGDPDREEGDARREGLSSLRRTFLRYAWKGLVWGANLSNATLLLPFVMTHVLQSYPTGEDFLESNGFDPALVSQVTDRKVHVLPRTKTAAFFAATTQNYFWGRQFRAYQEILRDYISHKEQGVKLGGFDGSYRVIIPCSKEMTSIEDVTAYTGIPANKVERTLMSNREVFLRCVLHELRHTSSVQDGFSPMMKESDAESVVPMRALFNVFHNERAVQETIYKRILQPDSPEEKHHMGLYLDAVFRNRPPPTEEQMREAESKARNLLTFWRPLASEPDAPFYVQNAQAYRAALAHLDKSPAENRKDVVRYFDYSVKHSSVSFEKEERETGIDIQSRSGLLELSGLARRFAELYVEGVEYFAPSSVGLSPTQAPPPNNYTITGDAPGVS